VKPSYGAVTISTWTKEQIDLSGFKTSQVLIRFGLRDNGDVHVADGWYIDDVEIKEKEAATIPFPSQTPLRTASATGR